MTAPATPCPHCGRSIAYKPAMHETICPANPDNRATYRAVLEDPARPGVLRVKEEYEEARGELFSGTFLMRTWACGWGDLAAHYGLQPREAEPRKPIQWLEKTLKFAGPEIDAQIERNRARGGKCSTVAKFTSTIRSGEGDYDGYPFAVRAGMAGVCVPDSRPRDAILPCADHHRLTCADGPAARARAAHGGGA